MVRTVTITQKLKEKVVLCAVFHPIQKRKKHNLTFKKVAHDRVEDSSVADGMKPGKNVQSTVVWLWFSVRCAVLML